MSKQTKVYASIIDQILDDNEPSYEGLTDAKKNGESFHSISKDHSDMKFLEDMAGKSHHTPVPGGIVANKEDWNKKSSKVLDNDQSLLTAALKVTAGEDANELGKKMLSDAEVKSRLEDLLHLGVSPKKIKERLGKIAEVYLFNHQMAENFLDSQSGLMGLSYIQPNHFMPSDCTKSMDFIKNKGELKAASVKKITACDGCKFASKQEDGSMRCNAYKLPIVSNEKELKVVAEKQARKNGLKTAASVKQILTAMHNNEPIEVEQKESSLSRVDMPATVQPILGKSKETKSFTASKVASLVKEGKSVGEIYAQNRSEYGSHITKTAIVKYISELKKTGAKVDIKQLDCSFLKGKLKTANVITGASKCASCSYRNGMHCGLTGGTLLTFPGMDKMSGKKTASIEAENKADGNKMMEDFGLSTITKDNLVIEDNLKGFEDIEVNSLPTLGDIE